MEYRKSEKVPESSGNVFRFTTYHFKELRTGMQSALTSFRHARCVSAWTNRLVHFACQIEASTSGVPRICKRRQNPEISRILALFHIHHIPLRNPPNWYANYFDFFRPYPVCECPDEKVDSLTYYIRVFRSGILRI